MIRIGGGNDSVPLAIVPRTVASSRWSKAKEKLFFDELAATANVKRAARAAGVSPNAVYARRMRDTHFGAKWAAALETGRASIEMHLIEAANKSFDPDEIDTGDIQPKVSVAQAIRIVQVHGSKRQQEMLSNPFADQAASMSEEDIEEAREPAVQEDRAAAQARDAADARRRPDARRDPRLHGPAWVKDDSA